MTENIQKLPQNLDMKEHFTKYPKGMTPTEQLTHIVSIINTLIDKINNMDTSGGGGTGTGVDLASLDFYQLTEEQVGALFYFLAYEGTNDNRFVQHFDFKGEVNSLKSRLSTAEYQSTTNGDRLDALESESGGGGVDFSKMSATDIFNLQQKIGYNENGAMNEEGYVKYSEMIQAIDNKLGPLYQAIMNLGGEF